MTTIRGTSEVSKFRAAVLHSLGSYPSVVEVSARELGLGQVLVEMVMAGICGSQLSEIAGYKGNARFLPHLMGHEGFGKVIGVGQGVVSVAPGDSVVLHWRVSGEGIAAEAAKFDGPDGIEIGSGPVSTFAEIVVVSENRVTKVPPETNPELATLMGCALSTATSALLWEAKLATADRLLVVGLGGLGVAALAASTLVDEVHVTGLDISPAKGMLSREIRDFSFIDISGIYSLEDEIGYQESGGFDVVFDSVADPELFSRIAPVLNAGARYVVVGQGDPVSSLDLGPRGAWIKNESVSIIVSQGGGFKPDTQMLDFIARYENAGFHAERLVTHKLQLDSIAEAFSLLQGGSVGRVVIEF